MHSTRMLEEIVDGIRERVRSVIGEDAADVEEREGRKLSLDEACEDLVPLLR